MGAILQLSDISVRRGDRVILGPLNWQVLEGQRWVILGPNGAGKTTLLQICSSLIHPTTGEIHILGEKLGRVDVFELRTRIGLTSSALVEQISPDELVMDVVLTAAYAMLGRWQEKYDLWDESRAMALLTALGVRELGERLFGSLSEGEKKRVQIARALMADPELLLLDEPASSLDLGGRELFKLRVVGSSLVPVNLEALLPKPWHQFVNLELLKDISRKLTDDFIPSKDSIFKCLELAPNEVKVVILGQDPYPNPTHAMGLAFSVHNSIKTLPASLKNIFKELDADLSIKRIEGDLSDWASQGVLLLNRSLTVIPKLPDSHADIGWHEFTEEIIRVVASKGAIGVLWGKQAQNLSGLFNQLDQFSSPHPSPLSAYRGFFGSKPFSKVNNRLREKGLTPIKW